MKLKLLLLAISFLVSLVVFDRLAYMVVPKPCTTIRPDKLVHHSLTPNKTCDRKTAEFVIKNQVNSLGLRDREFPVEKTANEYRVLVLGDSFVEGAEVKLDELFSKLLETKLDQISLDNRKYRVINAGVGAYSPILEELYLKHRGIKLSPDAVVVALFMNDFNDDRSYLKKAHYNDKGEISGVYVELKQHLPNWLITLVEDKSYVYYQFKRNEKYLWKLKGKLTAVLSGEEIPTYANSGTEFQKGNPDYDPFAITRDIPEDIYNDLFQPTTDSILRIKKFLDEKNIPLMLMVIPAGHQVSNSQWAEGRLELHLNEASYPDEIFNKLADFSTRNEISLLDLAPSFRQYALEHPQEKLYFDIDGHFTPAGHKLTADQLLNHLQQLRLVAMDPRK